MPPVKQATAVCPVCEEGTITRTEKVRVVEHRNQTGKICLQVTLCDHCGAETADSEQSILNRRAIIRFRKQADRIPLGAQIRTMRKAARLNQAQAGALFGGGPVAFSKYENDDLIPDEAMTNLLRLAIADLSIINKLKSLKAEGTTTSILMVARDFIAAQPSSTWMYEDTSDEFESAEFERKVSHRTSAKLGEQTDHCDWKRVN